MNRRYIKGRNFEYKVKKYFEEKGYYVIRAAGSKGIADLVLIPPYWESFVSVVQCKNMSYKKVPKKEIKKLLDFASKYWCDPKIVARNGRSLAIIEGVDELEKFLEDKRGDF